MCKANAIVRERSDRFAITIRRRAFFKHNLLERSSGNRTQIETETSPTFSIYTLPGLLGPDSPVPLFDGRGFLIPFHPLFRPVTKLTSMWSMISKEIPRPAILATFQRSYTAFVCREGVRVRASFKRPNFSRRIVNSEGDMGDLCTFYHLDDGDQ
jgi:hypothetical protein